MTLLLLHHLTGRDPDQSEVAFGESDVDGHEALQRAVKAGLTTRTIHLIKRGSTSHYDGDRSRRDAGVVTGLLLVGASPDDILAIFETFPVGNKFLEPNMGERYLTQTIRSVEKYLARSSARPRPDGFPRWLIEHVAAEAAYLRLHALRHKLQGGAATVRQLQSQLGWARNTVEKHIRIGLKLNMVEVVAEGAAASEGRTRGRPPRLYRLSPSAEAKGVRFLNMKQLKIKRILLGEAP
jgi:hypothetical protein